MKPNYSPQTIARWLRRCGENPLTAGQCSKCPFGLHEAESEEESCMDTLHNAAAELIEQQNNIRKELNR